MKRIASTIVLLIFFLTSESYSFDFNKIYNIKIFSPAKVELNNTNLLDEEHAEELLSNVFELDKILKEESIKIKEKNRNRKKKIYKGAAEDIYEDFANSVVFIGTRIKEKRRVDGIGSGFVVNHNGLKIITNWHVIENAEKIDIWLKPKKMVDENYLINSVPSYSAQLIKVNKKKDLAMLEVSGLPLNITPVKYGKFNKVRPGQIAFAIGHPKGLLWSFTQGMISQVRPDYIWRYRGSSHKANVIQNQASINPGNSGGPLFNKNKQLIGVNTFTSEGESLNFAIAVDDVVDFLNEKPKPKKSDKSNNKWIKKKKKGPTWIKKKEKSSSGENSKSLSVKEVDLNDNGIIDHWLYDENNNGIYEKCYGDPDEDGLLDYVAYDENEDRNPEIILYDKDNDGNPDLAEIDKDEDGEVDVIAYDFNQDGKWDKYENVG